MFTWDDLKHFLAFARTGSILSAATSLGVNHSTVQRRIADLESRLGERLVERHLSGYRLTPIGAELVPFAERVEGAAAAFERQTASRHKALTGTVRVTCAPTVGERLKRASLFDAFEAQFPGLRIELVMSDRFFDLSKGEADIAIRSRGGEPEDEALVGRKITDLHWALYASRAYVERQGQPNQPGDIRNHRIIQCTGGMASHAASRWLRAKAPQAIVGAYSESWPGLVMALKSGAGIAALPIAHGDGEPELVRVTDQIPDLVTHLYLLSHRDMQRAPRIRAFFDFVAAEIKGFRSALTKPQGKDHRANLSGPDLGTPTNERR